MIRKTRNSWDRTTFPSTRNFIKLYYFLKALYYYWERSTFWKRNRKHLITPKQVKVEPVFIQNPGRWFFLSPLGWMDECAPWGGSSSMESETYTVWGRGEKKNVKLRLFKYRASEGPSLALWQVFLWSQWWWQRWVLTHCTYMPGTHSERCSYISPHDSLRHCTRDTEGSHPGWHGWDVELLGEKKCRQ